MKRFTCKMALLLASAITFQTVQPASADEQGWGMMVKSPHVGILYLYVTNQGFAIVFPKTGAKFVTHAPDWRVVMYNDKTKVYYVERLNELKVLAKNPKGKTAAQQLSQTALNRARRGSTNMVAGLPATQYFVNTYASDGGAKQAEAWITAELTPPKQLSQTLGKIFSLDTTNFPKGMPLKVKISDENGKSDTIFDTLKCERQIIRSASFTYPVTYRRVDNEIAVLVDEQSRKKMESILEDSEELDSILGPATSSKSSNKPAPPSYASNSSASGPSSSLRPLSAATPGVRKNQASNSDWWTNMFSTLNRKK